MSLDPSLFSRIKSRIPYGWTALPIPLPVDDDFAELVDAHTEATGSWRRRIAAAVDEEIAAALLGYAERMASLGVRHADRAAVERGLAAVGLAWATCPEIAHAVVALAVLYDAARRGGGSAEGLFSAAAARAPSGAVLAYSDFLRRTDLDRVAAAMGFIDGRDGDGFRYYRVW